MGLTSYVTLGRSGLRVSPFCLGTMTFGEEWGWGATPEESARILAAYVDRGGNFIDTANIYTMGHSEKIIGDYLAADRARRDRLVIATKYGINLHPHDPNGGGAGLKGLMSQLDESLRRLRTDHIDLYWLHCDDRFTPIEEILRGLDDVVRSGKVRYVGFSDMPAWRVAQAQTIAQLRGWSPLVGLQIEYSLLERTGEGELVPMAMELGLGITPWSPLRNGLLSGKYSRGRVADQGGRGREQACALGEREFALIDALEAIAQEQGVSVAQVALAWVRAQPGISSVIVGVRTLPQLDENLAALDIQLSHGQMERLNALSRPVLNFPAEFLAIAPSYLHAGATVNGIPSSLLAIAPQAPGSHF